MALSAVTGYIVH